MLYIDGLLFFLRTLFVEEEEEEEAINFEVGKSFGLPIFRSFYLPMRLEINQGGFR